MTPVTGQSVKSDLQQILLPVTGTNPTVAGYRYSTQGFYNLSDGRYGNQMKVVTPSSLLPETPSEQTLFVIV